MAAPPGNLEAIKENGKIWMGFLNTYFLIFCTCNFLVLYVSNLAQRVEVCK